MRQPGLAAAGLAKAARLTGTGAGLQNLPRELLAGIGEQFLDYPVRSQ